MINNRQNGRRRGRGGQQQRPQGGSQGSRDSGNRIDSRARGNASQLYEKYKNMASDAQRQGDRVNTEYYLQFADHYFRVMADQRGRYEEQNPQQRRAQNDFDADEDFGDEGEPIRTDEQTRGGDDRGERDGYRQQSDGNRSDSRQGSDSRQERQPQDGNRAESRQQYDGNRQEPRQYDSRQRSDRDDNRQQGDEGGRPGSRQRYGSRNDTRRDEPRRDDRANGNAERNQVNVDHQPVAAAPAPVAVEAPQVAVAQSEVAGEAPVAKRRGRPRKVAAEGEQPGLDTSVLPPSIGGGETASPTEDAPKPRRRRTAATPAEVTSAG